MDFKSAMAKWGLSMGGTCMISNSFELHYVLPRLAFLAAISGVASWHGHQVYLTGAASKTKGYCPSRLTVTSIGQKRASTDSRHSRCQDVAKANRSVWGVGAKVLKATAHN